MAVACHDHEEDDGDVVVVVVVDFRYVGMSWDIAGWVLRCGSGV